MAGEQETLAQPTDTELLEGAFATEQPETVEQPVDDGAQPRDEHGRFASSAKAEPEAVEQPVVETKPEPEKDHRIPIRELLDERDRRQAAERKAEALERERSEWARRQREAEETEQVPDPIVDPQGYDRYVRSLLEQQTSAFQQELRKQRVDDSFDAMVEKHGDAFDKAVGEFIAIAGEGGSKDRALFGRIVESRNPGRALWSWHQDRRAVTEIGGDLDGYKAKHRAELMKDPEFRKAILAEIEAEARAGSGGNRSTVISLPSVNRAGGGGSGSRPATLPSNDADFFNDAVSGIGRR